MNLKVITSFLGQHYERVVALFAMLALVLFSAWLMLEVGKLKSEIKQDVAPQGEQPPMLAYQMIKDGMVLMEHPPTWTTNADHRLFMPHYMKVYSNETYPRRYDETKARKEKTSEGITIGWLNDNNLPTDQLVGGDDPDKDGFTNLEEYQDDTNPNDPGSKPDAIHKLRVVRIFQRDFPLIFRAAPSDERFEIEFSSHAKQYVDLGGFIKDPNPDWTGYKVIKYASKTRKYNDPSIGGGHEFSEDVSELTVQKEGEPPRVLVRNKTAKIDTLYAKVRYLLENREFDVCASGKEQAFTLQGNRYQVLSIKILDTGAPEVITKRLDSEQAPYTLRSITEK